MRAFHAAVLGASVLLLGMTTSSRATSRYVATGGVDGGDCSSPASPCGTITYGLAQTASGDVVNVATGIYRENLRVEASTVLSILGGWDPTFATRDPVLHPTTIRAGKVNRPDYTGRDRGLSVFAAGATIDLTLDGFVLTKGFAGSPLPDIMVQGPGNLLVPITPGGAIAGLANGDSILSLTLRHVAMSRNKDTYAGGAMYLAAVDGSSLTASLDDVRVEHNTSTGEGSGIALVVPFYPGETPAPASVSLTMVNSVLAHNVAKLANKALNGALSLANVGPDGSTVSADIESSTITKNVFQTLPEPSNRLGGAGIYISLHAPQTPLHLTLRNSIAWGNKLTAAGTGADVFEFADPNFAQPGATLDLDHSDVGDIALYTATLNDLGGNVAVNPRLSSRYTLSSGSPVIDVGTCAAAPPVDFQGDPRPSGAGCDMGADEFVP
jgi:hypothetical protein